ncbi:MAG: threonylcarbamoyl-AMP synthase [Acidobacteria bacterium]|nr:threonylcarbamoyl-AMP synthase [Acidobacteriota bacterium]
MRTETIQVDPERPDPAAVERAASVIRRGGLVAFPTETVYGLGADATSARAVAGIFEAKQRPSSDPLIVHLAQAAQLGEVAQAPPPIAMELAGRFWPGPLTLVLCRGASIPAVVSAGLDTVAVRVPAHPVAKALLEAARVPIAAPSANLFARPSPTTASHVLEDLDGRIDMVLDGGAAPIGVESTVLDLTGPLPLVLRPGGTPLEALEAVLPQVAFRPKHLPLSGEAAASPGMLLKHYSPKAALWLFRGTGPETAARMLEAAEGVARARRVGVLAFDEELESWSRFPVEIYGLGPVDQPEQAARRLFAGLRELDRRGVEIILARGPARQGLGEAVWDRLFRAAEGRLADEQEAAAGGPEIPGELE